MGNRMIKESVRMSEQIDQLSWFEEVMFYRLIVTVDDYGIYSADPVTLSHILFPRKENVTKKMISDGLQKFAELGLIVVYEVEGKGQFLQFTTWGMHQRLRNSVHKYPTPEEGVIINVSAIRRKFPQVAEKSGLKPSRTINQEETNLYSSEQTEVSSEPSIINIPLNDNTEYGVTQSEVDEYMGLYPAVDVVQELRGMRGWCLANPKKLKTRSGIKKFINSWLSRAQNNGGRGFVSQGYQEKTNPYASMVMEGQT